jgi:hypothetical protein
MTPHAFDLFGAACLVLALGCAAGLVIGLIGMALDKLTSWAGGLLDRPKRRG